MLYWYIGIAVAVVAAVVVSLAVRRRRARTAAREETAEEAPPPSQPEPAQPAAIAELSTLSEHEKRRFLNAIWYRCENPDCNHSKFLDVHHIVPELEGGTHAAENLIVLCGTCQGAALSGEIPREQLQAWLRPREERFKYDLSWIYK